MAPDQGGRDPGLMQQEDSVRTRWAGGGGGRGDPAVGEDLADGNLESVATMGRRPGGEAAPSIPPWDPESLLRNGPPQGVGGP